ncbi:MAG: hypothetical protein MUQ20_00035 [Deltaproteobacteria bacterium]|nr:hypothetical protein [Deltaproteobacteria bacterium]
MKRLSIFIVIFFAVLGLVVWGTVSQAADTAPASMIGTWKCATNSPAGNGTSTFVLQQDGEKINGTYQGDLGESKVTGKIQGSDFELSYNISRLNVIYKGKVEGNKMSGTIVMGSYGEATFTGKRQK